MDLDNLLKIMTQQGASDLHLKPTRPPLLRLNGKLLPLRADPIKIEDMKAMRDKILTDAQRHKLDQNMSVDLGYGVPGVARFRGNVFMQRGNLAACFRRIPYQIKSLEELDLPSVVQDFCHLHQGLVLITGPTGSGKSTTLAAMIKHITTTRPVHIITVEDPMEFLFGDGVASISQRELGTDTVSFAEALRNAMRQDPDVILVGEMRDPETIQTVITAAETGHLVFSTLHTNSSTQTIDRILDSFGPDQQSQVRAQLAQVLDHVVGGEVFAFAARAAPFEGVVGEVVDVALDLGGGDRGDPALAGGEGRDQEQRQECAEVGGLHGCPSLWVTLRRSPRSVELLTISRGPLTFG